VAWGTSVGAATSAAVGETSKINRCFAGLMLAPKPARM
jgi:hypothetical protein